MTPVGESGGGPLDALGSPEGALAAAIAALLLVIGLRHVRAAGGGPPAGAAAIGYAAAIAVTLLASLGLLPGAALAPAAAVRFAGGAALVGGLLLAGAGARRASAAAGPAAGRRPPAHLVHGGLVLVLVGQLLRAPTSAGAIAVAAAALLHAWAARTRA